jgi:hypothetical protein
MPHPYMECMEVLRLCNIYTIAELHLYAHDAYPRIIGGISPRIAAHDAPVACTGAKAEAIACFDAPVKPMI